MKLLITGGLGFIGSHLVEKLSNKNNEIIILTKTLSKRSNLKNLTKNIKIKKINLTDFQKVGRIIENFEPDVIIHLAGNTSHSKSFEKPLQDIENKTKENNCGTCTKCIDVCPTDAFVSPYKLDARKCISYLTIENGSHIPREFRKLIGNRISGCDDCLAICPWNKFAQKTKNISFTPREDLKTPTLMSLSLLTDTEFRTLFSGSPIKRIGRNRFVRNVLIAIGNSKSTSFVKIVKTLLDDDSPLVRAASVWALFQIMEKNEFIRMKKDYINKEKDFFVLKEWKVVN